MKQSLENFLSKDVLAMLKALKSKADLSPEMANQLTLGVSVIDGESQECIRYQREAGHVTARFVEAVDDARDRIAISLPLLEYVYLLHVERHDESATPDASTWNPLMFSSQIFEVPPVAGKVTVEEPPEEGAFFLSFWLGGATGAANFEVSVRHADLESALQGTMNPAELMMGKVKVEGDATAFMALMLQLASLERP